MARQTARSQDPVPPSALRRRCDESQLAFETTAELEDLPGVLGQTRAVDALRFAIGIRHDGYNAFVLGPEGAGRRHLVHRLLAGRAADVPTPDDLVYVHNFASPVEPRAIRLPPGRAVALRDDLAQLVGELAPAISAAFESDEYAARRAAIDEDFEKRQRAAIDGVREQAEKRDVGVLSTPTGIGLVPLMKGEPIPPAILERLPDEEKKRIDAAVAETREQVAEAMRQLPIWAREHRARVRDLDAEVTRQAAGHLVEETRSRWTGTPAVLEHLDAVRDDVVDNRDRFRSADQPQMPFPGAVGEPPLREWTRRYQVNVLLDHADQKGAPVIHEDNPTLQNLLGRVEYTASFGALVTDFTLIRPGALHRANGGFLVVEARKLLTQPHSWDHLKRALRSREVRIESLGQAMGLISTTSLQPEPVPLDVKVVLVGDRMLYTLLSTVDPEFNSFFKVPADVEDQLERTDEGVAGFARMMATLGRADGLRPLSRSAVASLVEQASRLAGDSQKLSTHMQSLVDLLHEADHYAGEASHDIVDAADVEMAIERSRHRHGRIRDRMLESQLRDVMHVETDGAVIGQVNGLSVISLGREAWGRPTRITARVQLGRRGVVDIEREVELGGPIHSKGVLILAGLIGARYARQVPLAFSASVVFEQSYGQVEGDSASLAESLALLSALGELPMAQGIAVTGSIDQLGRVQAVGGVNQKIEGYFGLCEARGLTGRQGVVLPASNVAHLALDRRVVEAAEAGRFSIWAVRDLNEALALLTGMEAGERDSKGQFPTDSANRRVEDALVAYAADARAWQGSEAEGTTPIELEALAGARPARRRARR